MGRSKLSRRKECLANAQIGNIGLYFGSKDGMREPFSTYGWRCDMQSVLSVAIPVWAWGHRFRLHNGAGDNSLT